MMDILEFYTQTLAANGFERPSDDIEKMAEERGEHPDRVKMAKAIYEQMILDGLVQEKYASSDAALQDAFEMADKYAEYVHQEVKEANALANGLLRVCKHAAEGFLAQHNIDDLEALEAVKIAGLQAESALEEEAVKAAESECAEDEDDEKKENGEKDASAGGEPPGKRATAEGQATLSVGDLMKVAAKSLTYDMPGAVYESAFSPTVGAWVKGQRNLLPAAQQMMEPHLGKTWQQFAMDAPKEFGKVMPLVAESGRGRAQQHHGEGAAHLDQFISGMPAHDLPKMTGESMQSGLGAFAKKQDPSIFQAAKGLAVKHPVATAAAVGIPLALGAMHVMKRKKERDEENRRRRLGAMAGLPPA